MSNSRLAYIDVSKGILISIVIFHHISFQAYMAGIHNGCIQWNFTFLPFYASWFMPAFFIITGMCSNFNRPFKSFLLNNISTLIWPMFTFYVITSLLLKVGSITLDKIIQDMSEGLNWFLISLFFSKIIFFCITKIFTSEINKILFLIILSAVAIYSNDLNFLGNNWIHHRHSLYLTFFLEIGYLVRKKKYCVGLLLSYSWIIFFILLIGCFITGIDVPGIAGKWINFSVFLLPLHLLMAITGSFMLLGFSLRFNHIKAFDYMGKNSLVFYLPHAVILGFMVRIVTAYLINPQNKIEAFGFNCVVFFSTIIVCSLLTEITKREPLSWLVKMPVNKE